MQPIVFDLDGAAWVRFRTLAGYVGYIAFAFVAIVEMCSEAREP